MKTAKPIQKPRNEQQYQSTSPRIPPVEKPDSLKLRLAYWLTRKKLGKAITPLKVVQSRMPYTLGLSQKLAAAEEKLTLPEELVFYLKSFVASLNGCTFCVDIAKALSSSEEAVAKYEQLLNFEDSDAFSKAEKAALRYAEEATRNREVADETFRELRRHYSDREIVEITWLNAVENYYNLINRPLRIGSDNLCPL